MSKLISTLDEMGLAREVTPAGIWLTLKRGSDAVHFMENSGGTRFYTWCDNAAERTIQAFSSASDAIHAGLGRCNNVPGLVIHATYLGLSAFSLASVL